MRKVSNLLKSTSWKLIFPPYRCKVSASGTWSMLLTHKASVKNKYPAFPREVVTSVKMVATMSLLEMIVNVIHACFYS